jgi:hypothetical protein
MLLIFKQRYKKRISCKPATFNTDVMSEKKNTSTPNANIDIVTLQ